MKPNKVHFQVAIDPEIADIFRSLRKKWKTTNEGVLSNIAIHLKEKQ
jgi:hypothetical protein